MTARPPQPPEMALIQEKREAARLSLARAAEAAGGRSETWWRWKEAGSRKTPLGYIPERAKPDAVAAMAHAVGVTPRELRDRGAEEAAEELEKIIRREREEAERDTEIARRMVAAAEGPFTPRQRAELEGLVIEALRDIRGE